MGKRPLNAWEIARLSSQIGFQIALPIAGGTLAGSFLDKKLGSAPIFTLVFLLAGIVLAFWSVFKKIKEIEDASH